MYSLDINFLKDRTAEPKSSGNGPKIAFPIGNLTPVYVGVALSVFFLVLTGLSWWLLQAKNGELADNVAQLEQQKQKLDQQIGDISKIKEETNKIQAETKTLVTVFDQIRSWSAILQDLRDRIPATVQIQNVKQTPPTVPKKGELSPNPSGGLEITGFARSFSDVNDFLLTLQASRFFKATETKITTGELVDAPISQSTTASITGAPIKPPLVVKYTIQSSLSDVPDSELIRELEQKGAVGLVARLRTIQQIGAIHK